MADTPKLTPTKLGASRAQRRAAKRAARPLQRARRKDPKAKARRLSRLQAKQRMAVDRVEQINLLEAAFKVGG